MDERTAARARANAGVVPAADLPGRRGRAAVRGGLVVVQPRAFVAVTQPIGAAELVAAVRESVVGSYALLDQAALWLHGAGERPDVVRVGVPHSTRYRARPPLEVRRVAPAVLRGARTRSGAQVVALEIAVVQACAAVPPAAALAIVEQVLRDRRTTLPGLRGRLRRGLAGSAAVRLAVDELVGTSLDAAVRQLAKALAVRGVVGLRPEARLESPTGASAYIDLLDDASQTAIEVDGYVSHSERARFKADRRRDRWVHGRYGILTVRVDTSELSDDLAALADELAELVLSRRALMAHAS